MKPLTFESLSGVLPSIPAGAVAVLNRLAATQWVFSGQQPDEEAEPVEPITISFVSWARRPEGFLVRLFFDLTAGRCSVVVETAFLDLLSDYVLPGWRDEDPANLPVEWRAVLSVEKWLQLAALADAVNALEAELAEALPGRNGPDTMLEVQIGFAGQSFACLLELDDVSRALPLFDRTLHPVRHLNYFQPPLPFQITLPALSVPIRDFTGLRPGDLIIGGGLRSEGFETGIAIEGHEGFMALINADGSVTVSSDQRRQMSMSNIDYEETDRNTLEDDDESGSQQADALSAPDGLDDLPVRVEVVLGAGHITLSQLRCLGPGAVFPIDLDLSAPVTIRANGRAMAKGYLVRVDERIAVQIRDFPGMHGGEEEQVDRA